MGTQRQPTPQPGPDEKTLAGGGAREFGERLRREGGSHTHCPPQPFLPRHSDVLSCPPDKAKPHPRSQGGTWETKAPAAGRGGGHPTGTQLCHSLRARGEHPWGGCACQPLAGSAELGHWGGMSAPRSPAQAGIAPTAATPRGMTSIWGDGAMGRTSLGEQGKQAQPQRTFTEPPQMRSENIHQAGGSRATPQGPERCPAPSTIPQIFLQTKLPLARQGCSVCLCMCFQPSL